MRRRRKTTDYYLFPDGDPTLEGAGDFGLRESDITGIVVSPRFGDYTAAAIAAAYATREAVPAAHAVVDATEVVALVPDAYVAQHAIVRTGESLGLDIVLAPDDDLEDALERAAEWVADKADDHSVRILHLTPEEWFAAEPGLIGAYELVDDGVETPFPWERFLDLIDRAKSRRRGGGLWRWMRPRGVRPRLDGPTASRGPGVGVAAVVAGAVVIAGGAVVLAQGGSDDSPSVAPPATTRAAAPTITAPPPATAVPTTVVSSAAPPPSTAAVVTQAVVDLSGAWVVVVDVTESFGACADEAKGTPPYERTVVVTVDGGEATVVGLGDEDEEWLGSVEDGVLTFDGDRAEDEGTTVAFFKLRLDPATGELAGTEDWTWSDPDGSSCPDGFSVVTATRAAREQG